MRKILVSDIMTRDAITIKPETNLLECAKNMVKKRVNSLLLVDQKRLVGFLDQSDILWALIKKSEKELKDIRAIDISPRKLATIKPTSTIDEAIIKMKTLKFERLPVIHGKELVGIITIKDILNFKPEIYPELEELAEIREEAKKLKRLKKAEHLDFEHDGICEECGNHEVLSRVDGKIICETCQSSL
ncbi:MAG: CBS domain-containing protein [Nanoarchaeota archaeon]